MAASHVKVMLLACIPIFRDVMELREDVHIRDMLVKSGVVTL
jgi:hypothetical protein